MSFREYYRSDLKPFPYLSESCEDSRPSFPLRDIWHEYIKSAHLHIWLHKIHRQVMWECMDHEEPYEGLPSTTALYLFSTPSNRSNHIVLHHPDGSVLPRKLTIREIPMPPEGAGAALLDFCPLYCFAIKKPKRILAPIMEKDSGKGKG